MYIVSISIFKSEEREFRVTDTNTPSLNKQKMKKKQRDLRLLHCIPLKTKGRDSGSFKRKSENPQGTLHPAPNIRSSFT